MIAHREAFSAADAGELHCRTKTSGSNKYVNGKGDAYKQDVSAFNAFPVFPLLLLSIGSCIAGNTGQERSLLTGSLILAFARFCVCGIAVKSFCYFFL